MLQAEIKDFINTYTAFLILGHKEPDGDCVSSQLCLAAFLHRIGKTATCYSDGPFDRPEIAEYEPLFHTSLSKQNVTKKTAAIVVDCSTPERVGSFYNEIKHLPVLIIDHHKVRREFSSLTFIDSRAPSTTWLINRLITGLGYTVGKKEALLLLFGLCTDTGFFRHLDEASYDVFPLVSTLTRTGANLKQVYKMIYGGKSFLQRRLLARLLLRAESHLDDKLIITCQLPEDTGSTNELLHSSDELYNLLQTVKNNEIVVFIRRESATLCSVGLRSNNEYDVAQFAARYGGGGHKLAAGFTMQGSITEIRDLVLAELKQLIK